MNRRLREAEAGDVYEMADRGPIDRDYAERIFARAAKFGGVEFGPIEYQEFYPPTGLSYARAVVTRVKR